MGGTTAFEFAHFKALANMSNLAGTFADFPNMDRRDKMVVKDYMFVKGLPPFEHQLCQYMNASGYGCRPGNWILSSSNSKMLAFLKEADKDKDGKLSFAEIIKLLSEEF